MFEIRWFLKDTGKTSMNEWGYFEPVINRTLQYRYKYSKTVYGYNPGLVQSTEQTETVWSEWTEVPTVLQSKEK